MRGRDDGGCWYRASGKVVDDSYDIRGRGEIRCVILLHVLST